MFYECHNHLLARATEICTSPDGAYARFQNSVQEMGQLISPYLAKLNAPEEEKQRLVGHYGLFGETGNSISQIMLSLREDLKGGSEKDLDRSLNRIFLLSTLDNYGSQYSHRHLEPSDRETVIAACNRIINDIGKWTDDHVEDIEPRDRLKILGLRHNFAQALDEIYAFMQEARPCFEGRVSPLAAPNATL